MNTVVRATALFFGFTWMVGSLASLLGEVDLTLWFFDVRPWPPWVGHLLALAGGMMLVVQGVQPGGSGARRGATVLTFSLLAGVAVMNGVHYYGLRSDGSIQGGAWVPFSLVLAVGLLMAVGWVLWGRESRRLDVRDLLPVAVVATGWALALPLAQMMFFGPTDYRRPADAIVVLGARAYANGRPSDALRDRVVTGVELYQQGLAPRLLFSGGPGDGAVHETESMRQLAISMGVPDAAIHLDPQGLNTTATARNTHHIAVGEDWRRVLVVSHAYHLPRVKMACESAGVRAFTVPARERYTLRKMPLLMLRETVAWWVYWARAATGR